MSNSISQLDRESSTQLDSHIYQLVRKYMDEKLDNQLGKHMRNYIIKLASNYIRQQCDVDYIHQLRDDLTGERLKELVGNYISLLMDDSEREDNLADQIAGSTLPLAVLIGIVIEYTSSFSSLLEEFQHPDLQDIRNLEEDIDHDQIIRIRDAFQDLVSFGQEMRAFFSVPNPQQIMSSSVTPAPNPHQVFMAFINFLLLTIEAIRYFESSTIYFQKVLNGNQEEEHNFLSLNLQTQLGFLTKSLRTELGFLTTFLADTFMHLQVQPTKNILIDIETVVNEVGSFVFSFFFTAFLYMVISEEYSVNMETMVNRLGTFLHSVKDIQLQTTDEVEEIKNAIREIKALVPKLESSIFTINAQVSVGGIWYFAIRDLLPKFDPLKTKIKEHCITVSKMPREMPPENALVSIFIVDSVCDDLMDLINNRPDMIVGVDDQIAGLHEELMSLGSSIAEIIEQQEAEHEELLIRTRDVAYEVEYVVNSLPPIWYLALRLSQLTEKIQLIANDVNQIKKSGPVGMPEVAKYPNARVSLQSTQVSGLEDNVVGIKEVKTEIALQLVRGPDHLQIVSIFGMPGIGKTTLANILYKDPRVVNHFDKISWCVVSQTYNRRNVLIDILSSLGVNKKETFVKMEDDKLAENLHKSLKGRRYLIVLDDIWDLNVWNDIKRYFPDDRIRSRILFTTRNKEVGLEASPRGVTNTHPFLSEGECWDLLQRKVFQDESCPQELVDIGKKIAANCNGLPLAVVVIAGVLLNVEKKQHLWQQVATNISSYMHENPDNCTKILELSYKHLPMHLKPCFLYFTAFKEDMEIPIQRLISLWIAEGFIKKEEHKSLDDTALEYLMKLIDRSLVLVSKRGSRGAVKTCKIHDLLLEMCSRIADESNFLKVIKVCDDDSEEVFNPLLTYQPHHCLSIIYGKSNEWLPHYIPPFGLHVRSLQFANQLTPILITSSFKVLRILDSTTVIGLEQLFHLRYLSTLAGLPSMENFHKLEFLYLDTSDATEIPEALLNMVRLRHIHFTGGAYFSESCHQRVTKDENFQINNNLESILVLSIFDEIDEKILRCLPKLRKLKCKLGSSSKYCFHSFDQLQSLKLSTTHAGTILIKLPPNLAKLTLVHVHLSSEQMKIIGRLQYLEILKLEGISFEEDQWDTVEGEFPQLKFLKLYEVQISEWNASSEHFPNLQQLVLHCCNCLETIPSSFCDIPTLRKIDVMRCAEAIKDSAKQIQKELEEMGIEDITVTITD